MPCRYGGRRDSVRLWCRFDRWRFAPPHQGSVNHVQFLPVGNVSIREPAVHAAEDTSRRTADKRVPDVPLGQAEGSGVPEGKRGCLAVGDLNALWSSRIASPSQRWKTDDVREAVAQREVTRCHTRRGLCGARKCDSVPGGLRDGVRVAPSRRGGRLKP